MDKVLTEPHKIALNIARPNHPIPCSPFLLRPQSQHGNHVHHGYLGQTPSGAPAVEKELESREVPYLKEQLAEVIGPSPNPELTSIH